MPRAFSFLDLARGLVAPVTDIVRLSNEISRLPAFGSGDAVQFGSVAWGTPTWRSDIDILAFDCAATTTLANDIASVRAAYERASKHVAPSADITLIGAEHEELVERDNLVSKSMPILEPRRTREIVHRVRVRLGHHIRALASTQGNPWRTFAVKYLQESPGDDAVLRDVLREYVKGIAAGWREHEWTEARALREEELTQLGIADGFATHCARLMLADLDAYPTPDRRDEVRAALVQVAVWGERFNSVLAPAFALADIYDRLAIGVRRGDPITSEEFDRTLRAAAAAINFNAIEELTWAYLDARPS